jgi:quinol monooxygenase YgiN
VIRIVKMTFKEEHIADFNALFDARKERIRNFPGCTYLELWNDQNDPSIFYTYSIWEHESNLEEYRISELFQDTWSTVKLWFKEKPQAFSATKLMSVL